MSRSASRTPARPPTPSRRCGGPRARRHHRRADQLPALADHRGRRPRADHRRQGDHVPLRRDGQPDRPAHRHRLRVHRGRPAAHGHRAVGASTPPTTAVGSHRLDVRPDGRRGPGRAADDVAGDGSASIPPPSGATPHRRHRQLPTLDVTTARSTPRTARCRAPSPTCCPQLARLVDFAVEALRSGNRVHYVGAGTSGRLAVLDAAELVPDLQHPGRLVRRPPRRRRRRAAHGGGERRGRRRRGRRRDAALPPRPGDFVLGLTASGRTPYVLGALEAARRLGAHDRAGLGQPRRRANAEVDVAIAVEHRAGGDRRLHQDEGGHRRRNSS